MAEEEFKINQYYEKLIGKSFIGVYRDQFQNDDMKRSWDLVESQNIDKELDKALRDILLEFGKQDSGKEKIWKGFKFCSMTYTFYVKVDTKNLKDLKDQVIQYKIKDYVIFGEDDLWEKAYKYEMKKGVAITLEPSKVDKMTP